MRVRFLYYTRYIYLAFSLSVKSTLICEIHESCKLRVSYVKCKCVTLGTRVTFACDIRVNVRDVSIHWVHEILRIVTIQSIALYMREWYIALTCCHGDVQCISFSIPTSRHYILPSVFLIMAVFEPCQPSALRYSNSSSATAPLCLPLRRDRVKVETLKLTKYIYYFNGRNFRGKKLSRFRKTAKYLHFAGINFRGWRLMKNFAGINFRGEPLSKDFPRIKKGENLNLWEETFVYCTVIKVGTWPVLKSLKKSFKKLVFHYSFFLEFLIFEILRMPQ